MPTTRRMPGTIRAFPEDLERVFDKHLQALIKQLRRDRGIPRAGDRSDGFTAGVKWARDPATTTAELLHLAYADTQLGYDEGKPSEEGWAFNFTPDDDWDVSTELFLDIVGVFDRWYGRQRKSARRRNAAPFWAKVLGDQAGRVRSGLFCRGFMEGAVDIYHSYRQDWYCH